MNVASWSQLHLDRFGVLAALVVGARSWTNRELHDEAARLAAALVALGVRSGDRVLLVLPSGRAAIVASTATWWCGAIVVFADPSSPAPELERIVAKCTPVALVALPTATATVELAVPIRIMAAPGAEQALGDGGLDALIEAHSPLESPIDRKPSDPAQLVFTSGSTGLAKATIYTHGGLNAILELVAATSADDDPAQVHLIALPPTAFAGFSLRVRWAGRIKLVVLDRFDPSQVLDAIVDHEVTNLALVPLMGQAMLAVTEDRRPTPSLRTIIIGGAHTPVQLADGLARRFGASVINRYGMTEVGGSVSGGLCSAKPGCVGRPDPGVELQIVDGDERPVAAGETGEIWARAPWSAAGYWGDTPGESVFAPDGWVRTGDRGCIDRDGDLILLGRRKTIINQAGFNVVPREVEEVIATMPGIADCAVIGVPDAFLGEMVVACVVRKVRASVSEYDILAHCRARLDPRKQPGRVQFFDDLPRTTIGKLRLDELQQRVSVAAPESELVRRLRIEYLRRVDSKVKRPRMATADIEATLPAGGGFVGPSTPEEETLAQLWSALLGVPRVGVRDDFFAWGGHSLLAIRLVAEIEHVFAVRIPLHLVFNGPTVGALAAEIASRRHRNQVLVDRPRLTAIGARRARLVGSQRGTYRLHQDAPTNFLTRLSWSVWLDGPLDAFALERSFAVMRERHGILRTRFFEAEGELWQEMLDPADIAFPLLERFDLSSLPGSEQERLDALDERLIHSPFDLAAGEVIRVTLVAVAPTRHRLTVSLHRVVCDDESRRVVIDELSRLWCAFTEDPTRDATGVLAPVPIQYLDLADYLTRLAASEAGALQRSYWQARLAGAPPLELPIDRPREPVDQRRAAKAGFVTFPAGAVSAEISPDLLTSVVRLVHSERTSVQSTLTAAMAAYLSGLTGQTDLSIISHLIYRHLPGFEQALGLFGNPLVMRISAAGSPTFRELVARTHDAATGAFDNGECDVLGLASHRLFRLWFNYMNVRPSSDIGPSFPSGLTVTPASLPGENESQIAYDLLLFVMNRGDRVALRLAYNRELFEQPTAVAFLNGYVEQVERLCRDPDAAILPRGE